MNTVPNSDEALEYIDDMVKARGYVLPYHKLMANADIDVLKAANELVSSNELVAPPTRASDPSTRRSKN